MVISNASAPVTVLDMVDRDRLPADYVRRLEGAAPSYTTVAIYLGLDRDLFAEHSLPHEVFVAPDSTSTATQPGVAAAALALRAAPTPS